MMQAVVRLRGSVNVRPEIRETLALLNLHRVNHCTFVPETDSARGMINRVSDYVAFGEPSPDTVRLLVERRGEPAAGGGGIDDEWVSANTRFETVDALVEALVSDETTLRDAGLSPVLRLHPPRGGHNGIKHAAGEGGELGRHSTGEIDDLLRAMR